MPEVKLFDETVFNVATSLDGNEKVAGLQAGDNSIIPMSLIKEFVGTQAIFTPAPEGIDDNTTARLSYGVNKLNCTDNGNFCCRLPETPIEGRSVTVINTGTIPLRIFPSVPGGDLEGVVDGHVDVLPNKKAVIFVCWDNPNPGSWSSAGRSLATTKTYLEMTVPHVNGVTSFFVGTNVATQSGQGLSIDGSGNMSLTPASTFWDTLNTTEKAVKLKVFTNIVEDDCAQDFNASLNGIQCYVVAASKSGPTSGQYGQQGTITFGKTPGSFHFQGMITNANPTGALSTPPNIGDTGTFYGECRTNPFRVGQGLQYSLSYFIFGMQIGENVATKNYKFRFELDYA